MPPDQSPPSNATPSSGSAPAAGSAPASPAEERLADHAAIERLADELVPALIAKLGASNLGEIEIGEDAWTVRVRRPGDGTGHNRRAGDRASRAQPGHAGHGHAAGGFEGHRVAREARPATPSSNGSGPGAAFTPGGAHAGADDQPDDRRAIATSPAVGVFQPRAEARAGTRVRSGDRLGAVDMLGVPQDVVAPADGIVGATLVEAGQAVEYGQELVVIELAARAAERSEA